MKRKIKLMICLALACSLFACSSKDSADKTADSDQASTVLTGKADGFGGEVVATVTLEEGKIVSVEIDGSKETEGIGTLAIDQLPAKIVEANSTDVDAIASATVTSEAIIAAVNNALASNK